MRDRVTTMLVAVALAGGVAVGCSSAEPMPDEEAPAIEEPDELEEAEQEAEEELDEVEEAAEEADREATRRAIQQAAEGEHRSEDNIARNEYRNPVETLMFFGFETDTDAVEIWPGGGWYTEVLAPVVAADGSLTAGIFEYDEEDPDTDDYRTRITLDYLELLEEHQDALGNVETGTFDPPETVEVGEPESAEMVLTFRNLHNMHDAGILEDAFEAYYEVLEEDGTLGVVQHRAPEGSDPDETAEDGYLPEQFVIETAEAAGFELEESSDINANPDDTADYEEGVWALPPTLRGGEEDEEFYKDIGESDRMTLRFSKP